MPLLVCTTATLRCSMGSTPSTFTASSTRGGVQGKPAGTIQDNKAFNVATFGMCRSTANPAVQAATAAAQGVFTQALCVPSTPTPWAPGSARVQLERHPVLRETDRLPCTYAGTIQVVSPGQSRVEVRS